jgi:sugar/nucleoside kinase (ribokinase family)
MQTGIKLMDVIVVGELNVDIILNKIEGFPEIGKEILTDEMIVTLGSSSAIFASNLSTLGANVGFIGKIGCDNFSNTVMDSLNSKNIDTSQIIKSKVYNTGATIVLNYDQDRAMVTYPGAMAELTVDEVDFDFMAQYKHLHLSSPFLQPKLKDGIIRLFQKAKELGLTTSLDPQWDPSEKWEIDLDELLPYVDVFLPNIKEILALTRTNTLGNALAMVKPFGKCTVVKNGEHGVVCQIIDELIIQPAFLNNQVVDCIGAGDTFNSGFISKYIQKATIPECLEFGALTGAINTTMSGGIGAFESIEEVKKTAWTRFGFEMG